MKYNYSTTLKKLSRFNSTINVEHYIVYLLHLINPNRVSTQSEITTSFKKNASSLTATSHKIQLLIRKPDKSLRKQVCNAGNTFDPQDQTKNAAMGVAVISANLLLGYKVKEVSKKGTRGDFYLGIPKNNFFVEVSGTQKDVHFNSRTTTKIKQISSSKVSKKSWVSVTSFQSFISNFLRVK